MRDKATIRGRTKDGSILLKGYRRAFPTRKQRNEKGEIEELIWWPTFAGQGFWRKIVGGRK